MFNQIEDMRVCTPQPFSDMGLPCIKRQSYSGTNMGNKIGDIVLPNYASLWQEKCKV